MRKYMLFVLMLVVPALGFAQKKKQKEANEATMQWRYEIEVVAQGKSGTVLIKVWNYSSRVDIAQKQAAKNAVHAVMFKGVPAYENVPALDALVSDYKVEETNKDFFDDFFKDGGEYMRYVTLTNNGMPAAGDVVKMSKKEYKVGVVVSVERDRLEQMLKDRGILKKLSSFF